MTTISASSTIGIVLSTPDYTNPIVINSGVTISGTLQAVAASSGVWTIQNGGTINGYLASISGAGVALSEGGNVTNQSGALISGFRAVGGVEPGSAPLNVVNYGSIAGNATSNFGAGVIFDPGVIGDGSVTNQSGAAISGFNGIYDATIGTVTVVNYGGIMGNMTSGAGVDLAGPGVSVSVTNLSGGSITGQEGIGGGSGALNLVNYGSIGGNTVSGVGIFVGFGGSVTNQSGASISGLTGISTGAGSTQAVTIINSGSITGNAASGVGVAMGGVGAGVSLTNESTGTISGLNGVSGSGPGGVSTIINAGRIAGNTTSASGTGVRLVASGSVTNESAGTISGMIGVYAGGPSGVSTIINAGSIMGNATSASGTGVRFLTGGSVTNQATGLISGYTGIFGGNLHTVSVVNAGSIAGLGTSGFGVELSGGGLVSNAATGTISASQAAAVDMTGTAGTVLNAGDILAGGRGIAMLAGGYVSNAAAGTISSSNAAGVYITGAAGTVINTGSIAGAGTHNGVALLHGGFVSNAAAGRISSSGAGTTNHGVYIGGGTGTLVNAGGIYSDGSVAAVSLHDGGLLNNAATGTITGNGSAIVIYGAASTVINAGTISGGAVNFDAGFTNLLVDAPGAVFSGGTVNGGNLIGASLVSTLELATGASAGTLTGLGTQFVNFGSIALDTGADWFVAGNTTGLGGTISGFAAGDTIEVTGITVTGSNYANNVLTLNEASGSATLDLPGSFTTTQFVVTNVAGGAEVSLACFRAGTRIGTPRGEVAVEHLLIGDRVNAVFAAVPAPIVWIGHRTVDCRNHPDPEQVWPVLIRAGAFGSGLPRRDLFLSPDHSVFVDDVLIPVRLLINGKTIDQVSMDEITYYHVELQQHDVLLAEGLPAESYLDINDRADFANGGGPVSLHPNFSVRMWEAMGCAPLVLTGPGLEAARRRLNARSDGRELFRSAAA